MSRITLYEESFQCNDCEHYFKEYVWSNREKNPVCPECTKENVDVREQGDGHAFTIISGKHKKGRTKAEAKKRATEHFKKEIMPTLGGKDRRYFERKHGRQG